MTVHRQTFVDRQTDTGVRADRHRYSTGDTDRPDTEYVVLFTVTPHLDRHRHCDRHIIFDRHLDRQTSDRQTQLLDSFYRQIRFYRQTEYRL